MPGLVLCLVALALTFWCARRSLEYGLLAVFAWGYAYAILRANLLSTASYFIFDSAVMGLYLGQFAVAARPNVRTRIDVWIAVLIGWPLCLVFLPFQPIEISIVGFRASVFFLPAMLLGARLRDEQLSRLAVGLAFLNVCTLGIALIEYFLGIERIFPRNGATELIYSMNDVANYTAYRIPASFSQAHVYAGTMLDTLPWLFGAWVLPVGTARRRFILSIGLMAALFGVLLSGARSAFVLTALAAIFIAVNGSAHKRFRGTWLALLVCIAIVTINTSRLQRFTQLKDIDNVNVRIAGSVNQTFWEVLASYPLGNGLGGGGTSVPYFWEAKVNHAVGLESEYCRIMIEQTVLGLMLWIGFILWFTVSSRAFVPARWRDGRRLAWFVTVEWFCMAMIGVGMFTAVPSTLLFFLMIGWVATPPASQHMEFGRRYYPRALTVRSFRAKNQSA